MDTENCVILKDFEVLACHGCNPEEKINKQRFLFTAYIYTDIIKAAKTDDIDATISYSAVKKVLKSFCEQNCFDLIETLAVRAADTVLKTFPLAKGIKLIVKKPDAPMSGVFDYVGVQTVREWHRAYLSLGSSEGDRNKYLDFAVEKLKADGNIKNVKESTRYETPPYGEVAQGMFINSCVECDTLYSPRQLLECVNKIEAEGGRVRAERWGDRTLDIDIVFYDDLIVEEKDLCIPHPDMHNRMFVIEPLMDFCPNKMHPVLKKRISEFFYGIMPLDD